MGQGVLEGVVRLGEQAGLVEELRGLEMGEAAVQGVFGQLGDGLQQGQGDLMANDGRGLQQPLRLGRQPVDARGQDRLHRGRHLDGRQRLRQAVGPRLAHQPLRFHQGVHALLQEERVALGALDQQGFERRQAGVIPQQGMQERLGAGRWQRVQPQLRVGGLVAPAVLVFRAGS